MLRQIPINDGRYWIDEYGNICNSIKDSYLHPCIFSNGYYTVSLAIGNGVSKKFLVHRLVAEAFLPNPNGYPVVMHLDNNRLNNYVGNLRWSTYSENNAQAIRDGLNVVPTPDNRKLYTLYDDNCPVSVDCYGVNAIIDRIGFGNDSRIRNYIFRHSPIPCGPFSGWKIQLASKRTDVQRSSPDGGVEPQAYGGGKMPASSMDSRG